MSKISRIWSNKDNVWFDELKSIAPYREYEYDKIIQSHLKQIFPEFIPILYSKKVTQKNLRTGSRPDFALIRKDYQEWWIVEVETIEDNLTHVKKQIEDFVNGEYNSVLEADYLFEKDHSLNRKKLKNLTQNNPKVLVIVDDINSKWINKLKELKPSICILKLYRDRKNSELYSISGDYPYIFENETRCYFEEAMQNLLYLVNPDILNPVLPADSINENKILTFLKKIMKFLQIDKDQNVDKEGEFQISYEGQSSSWKKVQVGEKIYLQPLDYLRQDVNDHYLLKRTRRNFYILEKK